MPITSGATFYLRFRGQVTGPFASDELRKMAKRGALARFHEVSPDQQQWSFAGKLPWIFAAGDTPEPMLGRGAIVKVPERRPTAAGPQFYYPRGGATIGPISQATLRLQVEKGNLEPDDLVWPEGADDPTPAAELPALADLFPVQYGVRQHGKFPWLFVVVGGVVVITILAAVIFAIVERR